MADTSIPEIKKYQPIVDGTVTATEGTSIGTGALTTSTNGLSVGRGNIASGGGMSAVELKRLLKENETLRNEINDVSREITNKKKEINNKETEILKLENLNKEAIANKDRVNRQREKIEEIRILKEQKEAEKQSATERLRELEVKYTEEIRKLNEKKEILTNLAINWTNENLSGDDEWMPRVEEWARNLKEAIDPDGTLDTEVTEEGVTTDLEFYKNYVTNYIKSYVVVPDLKNLLKNGDLKNTDDTISNPNWDIKDNALLKATGIEDGTLTKFDEFLLNGRGFYAKRFGVKPNERDNNDEIGTNFIKSNMDKYNLNHEYNSNDTMYTNYNSSNANHSSYSSISVYSSDREGEYGEIGNGNNWPLSSTILIKKEYIDKIIKSEMESTNKIFTKSDANLTVENVVNFYEDYKAARDIELTKINEGLDKLEKKGVLKPIEKEYRKYMFERTYEDLVLYDTIRAFNTVLQKLEKNTSEAIRITNEKKKILELYKNNRLSDERYNKEIELWNKVKEFKNDSNMKFLTIDEFKNSNPISYNLNLSGLKWYDENVKDVQNQNDKNTKIFLNAFSKEIERLKTLERDAKEEIKTIDTTIEGYDKEISKLTPNRTDEEIERDAKEKLKKLEDAKAELENKKNELSEKEEELKEKVNTLKENLNIDGGIETIAHGINNTVSGNKGIALGNSNAVSGENSIATGINNTITGKDSIAYGIGHKITGNNSGAFGDPITIHGDGSYGFGNNITIGTEGNDKVGKDTFVLGSEVTTTVNNAVILGKGSTGVENAISVGSEGHERKIVNVADGLISNKSKEAVNGSQLFAIAKGTSTDIDVDGWKNKLGINNLNGGISNITIKVGDAEKSITDGNKIEFIGGSGTIATVEGDDNNPKIKYNINVDGSTIEVNNNKVAIKDKGISEAKLDDELKAKIDSIDNKLNSADVTKDYLTNVLGKGSVTSTDFTITNGTDRLVGTGDLTISLKANSISEDKLDKDLRDKLARIGEVNPGAIPELTKGSLTGEEFTITGEGKLVDGDLTIALKDGSISKDKLNEELKNKIDAIDTKADKTEVDKKLNKDADNLSDTAVTNLINKLSENANLTTPTGKFVTDTTVKAALDNKVNNDLNNIATIGENGKSKLKEALGGADLNAPKDAFVTDTILKPVLENKLNKDADNLSDTAVTNLINKLSENANLTTPTGKFVTDTIIKPALDLKLNKSDLVKANLIGNGITVEGTGKVLDSDLTLSITDGAITKEKLAEDVKNEINAKANKDFVITELATVAGNLALKASVDASNIDGENLTKWKEKLGITVDGNVIATPNAISYTDETHTTINLGKDNQLVTIKNVATPVELTDAANKEYVDSKMNEAQNGIKSYVNNSVAMAQIPQVSGNKYFAFGAGAAYNGGKVGSFAFGISGQDKSKRFVYKASAGISTDKKWNVGAGFSVSLGEIDENLKVEKQVIPNDLLVAENKELKAKVNANEKQIEELRSLVESLLNNDNKPLNKEQKNVKKYTLNGYKISAYKLTETQIKELNELLKDVDKGRSIQIIGYTDTKGEDKANLSLGYNRALSVKQYFESLGYTNISISSNGFNLIVQDLKGDQALNRRVEIIIE